MACAIVIEDKRVEDGLRNKGGGRQDARTKRTARGAGVVLEGQSTVCETTSEVLILALGRRLDLVVGST